MLKHWREIIFECYNPLGLKFQNLLHCVSYVIRLPKSLAKEIVYEMFEADMLDVELKELREFGCDGCSKDITKFSKKSCRPRECLIIVRFKDRALREAIHDEIKRCIYVGERFETCIYSIIARLNIFNIDKKLVSDVLSDFNYEHYVRELHERRSIIDQMISLALERINTTQEELREVEKTNIESIVIEKLKNVNTDNDTFIKERLTPKEYSAFKKLKHQGRIVFDYIEQRWKSIESIQPN